MPDISMGEFCMGGSYLIFRVHKYLCPTSQHRTLRNILAIRVMKNVRSLHDGPWTVPVFCGYVSIWGTSGCGCPNTWTNSRSKIYTTMIGMHATRFFKSNFYLDSWKYKTIFFIVHRTDAIFSLFPMRKNTKSDCIKNENFHILFLK